MMGEHESLKQAGKVGINSLVSATPLPLNDLARERGSSGKSVTCTTRCEQLGARLLHCRGAWLVMGLGPCGERAHLLAPVLLCSVVVTRRALYQRPEGVGYLCAMGARGRRLDRHVTPVHQSGAQLHWV